MSPQVLRLPPWAYYCAVVFDGLARGPYALYISPGQDSVGQYTILLFGVLEMTRRAVWTVFRFELEELQEGLQSQTLQEQCAEPEAYSRLEAE